MEKSIPNHLGVIIDGNRRWAKERGLSTLEGHKKGLDALKSLIGWVKGRGIKILTVYVFSIENWNRSKKEVSYLMNLFRGVFKNDQKLAGTEDVRIRMAGERDMIPEDILKIIKKVEEDTKDNKAMTVNFAFSYGGRKEIIHSIKKIVSKKIPENEITEKTVSDNLYVTEDVDLIIRTGKEKRLSGFLTWQSFYSEFYFLEKYWPDFNEDDLDSVLLDYSNRQRRFGK